MVIRTFSSEQSVILVLSLLVLLIPPLRRIFFLPVRQKEAPAPRRVPVFDHLRGYAILAVIGIHVVQFFIEAHPESAGRHVSHYVINNILRFAVPVFFICSGILLNPFTIATREGLIQFYTRKLIRIFIPYIFCSVSVDLFKESTVNTLLWNILAGRALTPYYFMTVLFQLYLIYPLLIRWRGKRWFLPAMFSVSVWSFFQPQTWWFFGISTFLPYLFFFAWGIAKRDQYVLGERVYTRADLLVYILIILYVGFCLVRPEYYYNMRYIYGVAVFQVLYLAAFYTKASSLSSLIGLLGRHSLWIYLIHFPIIYGLFVWIGFNDYPYYGRMLTIYAVATVFSLVAAVLLSHIYRLLFGSPIVHKQYEQ